MGKKLLYVGAFELPDRNASAHRVLNNAKIMRMNGYDVLFCGYSNEVFSERNIEGFLDYSEKKSNSLFGRIMQLFSINSYKKVFSKHPDIECLCCYNLHAFQLYRLIKICKKRRIKIIGDITEWNYSPFSLFPLAFFSWLDTALAMKHLYKRFDSMICISSFLVNYYKRYIKSIIQIPPLVDASDSIWHQDANFEDDYPVFVYAGIPGMTKDRLDLVIEALSRIDENHFFKFYIAGISKDKLIKIYPKLNISLEKLDNKIVFCGTLNHKDTVKKLICSDYCFLIRNQNRKNTAGFPTKFVECITCGTKIISTDFSDIRLYSENELVFIIDDLDPENLSTAIKDIICRNDRGRGHVSTMFDYHEYANEFSKIL